MFILLIASWSLGNNDSHNTNNNILYGLSILIALPVIVHSVKPFFISAWHSIQNKHLINIDLFICVTLIVSCLMNFSTLFASNQIYLMCVFMFIGSLLAMRYMDMIRNH
jgi:cation transport ATPase